MKPFRAGSLLGFSPGLSLFRGGVTLDSPFNKSVRIVPNSSAAYPIEGSSQFMKERGDQGVPETSTR